MSDIVERLRKGCAGKPAKVPWPHRLLHEAADEIERLRDNIECLTNNKWSEVELAMAENKAHKLWMRLHRIERIGDLLTRAARAEKVVEAARGSPYFSSKFAVLDHEPDDKHVDVRMSVRAIRGAKALHAALAAYDTEGE